MRVAVLKPDHLGDLILASPAIRAIAQTANVDLFVSPLNRELARYLFPDLEVRFIAFPHLMKGAGGLEEIPDLRHYDLVVSLRQDHVLNADWLSIRSKNFILSPDSNDCHETKLEREAVLLIRDEYDSDELYFSGNVAHIRSKQNGQPTQIGLCISAGFHANCWPLSSWVALGELLRKRDRVITLIGGPAETEKLGYLSRRLCVPKDRIVMGGRDFGSFLAGVAELDLIVATDGGAAHLCSLRAPLLSLFGGSPVRRYAPYGRHNRVLTRRLSCSPCCQYASTLVNGCLSVECLALLQPQRVMEVVTGADPQTIGGRPRSVALEGGLWLEVGLSHQRSEASPAIAMAREYATPMRA